jgi:hypothetical protein
VFIISSGIRRPVVASSRDDLLPHGSPRAWRFTSR